MKRRGVVWLFLGIWACGGGSGGSDSGTFPDPGPSRDLPFDLSRDGSDPGGPEDRGPDGLVPGEDAVPDRDGNPTPEVRPDGEEDSDAPEDPCREDPGASWCPCRENRECQSGFCIATPEGRLCGAVCVENCPSGWLCGQYASNPDPIFLCLPRQPTLCLPCAEDRDCAFPGFDAGRIRCLSYGDAEGSFCGGPCRGQDECPEGYGCDDGQCRLEQGVCDCSAWAREERLSTPCLRTNGNGTCRGTRRCGDGGLSECSAAMPVPEACNGLDDDCDGSTDEDLPDLTCGVGECLHTAPSCRDGSPATCDPLEGSREEVCNGRDDDCDGVTDQGFPDTDRDGEADCVDPDDDQDGIPDDGNASGSPLDLPCRPGQATACDDNCPLVSNPGQEDLDQDGLGDACDPDQDGDGFAGVLAGGTDCDDRDPLRNPGRTEYCNGLDDNCDGRVDEGFPDADRDGIADCADLDRDNDGVPDDGDGSGTAGDHRCTGGASTTCDDNCPAVFNPDQRDLDGDGVGDPCDPDLDGDGRSNDADNCPTVFNPDQANTDGQPDGGDACDEDDDDDGVPDDQDCRPRDPAIHPGAAEGCNGLDDNCDGQTDEGYPDSDGDGVANCLDPDDDNDGILDDGDGSGIPGDHPCRGGLRIDCDDNCPVTPNPLQEDSDGDGIGDACETDTDGDGWPDTVDNCLLVPNPAQEDFDRDGVGDACDADDDGDGVPDNSDCRPLDPEVFPGATEACNGRDDNCDGRVDEGFPDTDGDLVADCVDPDLDGDGVANGVDNCPSIHNPVQEDFDRDGVGDACDPDQDGDGVCDEGGPLPGTCIRGPSGRDSCPGFPAEDQTDTDADGMGDPCDPDDDNDGVPDLWDRCPRVFDPGQEDFDGDGIGDACDPDLDGDGVPNDRDTCPRYDDRLDSDGDRIPEACEIQFAGHVWPPNGRTGTVGSPFDVFIQLWKPGVTPPDGPAPGIVVRVRWRIVGDGTWQEGNGTYNKDFWFVDDQGLRGYNEEHRFTIPAATTARGGTLEVDFVPVDLTGGPGYEHPYNNGPIYDQGWMVGQPKAAAPFLYPLR